MDERLLERYLESGYEEGLWYERAAALIKDRCMFPLLLPAAP